MSKKYIKRIHLLILQWNPQKFRLQTFLPRLQNLKALGLFIWKPSLPSNVISFFTQLLRSQKAIQSLSVYFPKTGELIDPSFGILPAINFLKNLRNLSLQASQRPLLENLKRFLQTSSKRFPYLAEQQLILHTAIPLTLQPQSEQSLLETGAAIEALSPFIDPRITKVTLNLQISWFPSPECLANLGEQLRSVPNLKTFELIGSQQHDFSNLFRPLQNQQSCPKIKFTYVPQSGLSIPVPEYLFNLNSLKYLELSFNSPKLGRFLDFAKNLGLLHQLTHLGLHCILYNFAAEAKRLGMAISYLQNLETLNIDLKYKNGFEEIKADPTACFESLFAGLIPLDQLKTFELRLDCRQYWLAKKDIQLLYPALERKNLTKLSLNLQVGISKSDMQELLQILTSLRQLTSLTLVLNCGERINFKDFILFLRNLDKMFCMSGVTIQMDFEGFNGEVCSDFLKTLFMLKKIRYLSLNLGTLEVSESTDLLSERIWDFFGQIQKKLEASLRFQLKRIHKPNVFAKFLSSFKQKKSR